MPRQPSCTAAGQAGCCHQGAAFLPIPQQAGGGLQTELVEVDNGGAEELNFILGGRLPGWGLHLR